MFLTKKENYQYKIVDIETDSLTPTCIWCCVIKDCETEKVDSLVGHEEIKKWFLVHKEEKIIFVGHNAISFDVPVLNRILDVGINIENVCDSLVLSYLYNPAIQGGHSLDAWGQRLKFPKSEFNDWSRYSEEMLKYCRNDVELTYKLYYALTEKMRRLGYSELSAEIEHKIRVILDDQQQNGIWFARERASDFRQLLRAEQQNLAEQISELFPSNRTKIAEYSFRRTKAGSPSSSYERHVLKYPDLTFNSERNKYTVWEDVPFNLGSPKQRVDRLLSLGWVPTKFTPTKTEEYPNGFPKVDEDALIRFQEELLEDGKLQEAACVGALGEWLVIQGRASMLDTWFNNLGEDSRIHGKVITCGASTRRMIHNSPNTANIPSGHKAKYGKECRSFWGVEPNKNLVLVGYDAAGLETAGLCHYLDRADATEILLRPKPDDIHTANARRLTEALKRVVDREWGAKTSWYAWLYGAYPKKLGEIVKGSKEDGETIINTFFKNVPGLKELIEDVQSEWTKNGGRLRTIDGGFVICPSLNSALNYKIQSAGTIVMKLAAILLDEKAKQAGIWFRKVLDVHDEGQLETKEETAHQLGRLAVECITEAGKRLNFRVVLGGDYKVGLDWSETH